MAADRYPFTEIEAKWQRTWEERKLFKVFEDPSRPKYYCLEMFPYPSGRIHMGHVRNYAIGDVVARYKTMRGYNVLHPMGWDAFGLPAENAAIEHGVHPAVWTHENIDYMRAQLKKMGCSYDWDREVATCDPDYYRWEQLIFIKMFERGLAYKKRSTVNWCPGCQTVLANEQVEAGRCWRCDSEVMPKDVEGWFFKITDYAEELLAGCERLAGGWPERVLVMQKNWIGRSEGAEVDFQLAERPGALRVFTTRLDTIYGATFMLLAPEHPMVTELTKGTNQAPDVAAFARRIARQDRIRRTAADTTKEGIFTGAYALNPFTRERIPIWIANFVLLEYGTGAVMAVPAHDQRDFEFAKQYGLSIPIVVQNSERSLREPLSAAFVDDGHLYNSGPYTGLGSAAARGRMAEDLERRGGGKRAVNYRLRDWGISRQRYWGAPIPILYCPTCGTVPEREERLPVVLPRDVQLSGKGGSPLADVPSFVIAACPKCGGQARRETDTMDTFVESSWYFLRFCSPKYDQGMVEPNAVHYWMAVDQYIGGIEHAVLHLLYARFYTKVLRDLGLVKLDEPFSNLLTQGMVIKDGAKMSKSKGNVVDPDELIRKYGADTARLFLLFAAPPQKDLDWNDQGVEGASRFLNRIWRFVQSHREELTPAPPALDTLGDLSAAGRAFRRIIHETVQRVTDDIEDSFHFNTAISAVMELVNALHDFDAASQDIRGGERRALLKEAVETLLILLAPFAPHMAQELGEQIGRSGELFHHPWPIPDPRALTREELLIVVQVDGRVRSRLSVEIGAGEETVKAKALADARIQSWLQSRTVERVVVVPGRLVNIVTRGE
ncbi:MAG: leucine--tRNA ligase [Candidatus Rokubacteria bacterium]|nr:leucine--tRNA ligase [Candidatus Rokubacteria bacterium]